MSVYPYSLGSSYPPTSVEELTLDRDNGFIRGVTPRSVYDPASVYVDDLDGHVSGHGSALVTWTFDILTPTMIAALRGICPGFSADVYLTTRIDDDSFDDFSGIMIWPSRDQMRKRNFNGRYIGLEFQFRQIEVYDNSGSLQFYDPDNSGLWAIVG